jgi:prepilin-type N-terminal cleavage/methylation domain-containing protein
MIYKKSGFSLVEMLVVISIVSILGIILMQIFLDSLRGGGRAQLLTLMKRNGQSVLDVMDKTIRNANSVICPQILSGDSASADFIIIQTKDDPVQFIRYDFSKTSSSTNGKITVSAAPAATSEDLNNPTNYCAALATSPLSMTDDDIKSGVSVSIPTGKKLFTRRVDITKIAPDIITINFNVGPALNAPLALSGNVDEVPFQTIIQLRSR